MSKRASVHPQWVRSSDEPAAHLSLRRPDGLWLRTARQRLLCSRDGERNTEGKNTFTWGTSWCKMKWKREVGGDADELASPRSPQITTSSCREAQILLFAPYCSKMSFFASQNATRATSPGCTSEMCVAGWPVMNGKGLHACLAYWSISAWLWFECFSQGTCMGHFSPAVMWPDV